MCPARAGPCILFPSVNVSPPVFCRSLSLSHSLSFFSSFSLNAPSHLQFHLERSNKKGGRERLRDRCEKSFGTRFFVFNVFEEVKHADVYIYIVCLHLKNAPKTNQNACLSGI